MLLRSGGSARPLITNARGFFGKSSMPRVPLDETWPNLTEPRETKAVSGDVKISTLKNGLRVASMSSCSPIVNLGVFVDSGSRYESHQNNGINNFLEQMAFKSTTNRTDFRLTREMGKLGAHLNCVTSREHMTYTGDCLRQYVPHVVGTFADVLQNNLFDEMEVQECRKKYEEDIKARVSMSDLHLMEGLHQAAYGGSLGLPLYAPAHNLSTFTPEALRDHMDTFFTGDRMVIAGVGIEHEELVNEVDKSFGFLPKPGQAPPKEPAVYTGGDVRMHNRDSVDGLTHVAIGFETASWHDKDLVPMCVLQMMMGGGGSFSAGGPGKGMYSRLYENVLNQHGWVESASSFNLIFSDSSLFGTYGTCAPNVAGHLVNVISQEAVKMAGPVDATELLRAKNQLKSGVFFQLESRGLQLEDIGRQVITYNKFQTPQQIAEQIDAITEEDIRRVASNLLKTAPSVAAFGDCSFLPRYETIADHFK